MVLQEDDFRSEWTALELAVALRNEVCPIGHDDLHRSCPRKAPPSSSIRTRPSRSVSFAPTAQVRVGSAVGSERDDFLFEVDQLAGWDQKPWRLKSGAADGSTAEEPLLSSVLSPAMCALLAPSCSSSCSSLDIEPVDYASSHVRQSSSWTTPLPEEPDLHPVWVPQPDALPSWWQSLRLVFDERAAVEFLEEGPILYVLTWFLKSSTHDRCTCPRVLRLDQHWYHWLRDLQTLWDDSLDPTLPAAVGFVQPTPPRAPGRGHSAHLILHQDTFDEAVNVYTLQFHGHAHNAFGQFAMVSPKQIAFDTMLTRCQVDRQCNLPLHNCVIQLPHQHVTLRDHEFVIEDYQSLIIHIDHPAFPVSDETDFDATSFMARGCCNRPTDLHNEPPDSSVDDSDAVSSSSVQEVPEQRPWYPVTVFSVSQHVGEGQANWRDPIAYRRNVATIMGLLDEDILQIYHVRWPPANIRAAGRQALIIEKTNDQPLGSTHKFVLIDVEFHPHRPSVQVEFVRAAYQVPEAFTRSNLLTFMGIAPFCRLQADRCLVWRNGALIPLQDASQIRPIHGDFFPYCHPTASRCPT